MTVPSLDHFELLLPLDSEWEARSWLGRDRRVDDGEIALVYVEQFEGEFLDREDQREQLVEEARRAGNLAPPNLHRTLDAGRIDGTFSVVREFAVGERLDTLLDSARIELPVAARIVADLLEGLAEVHRTHDLYHGAIHPAVIHVCWDGRSRLAGLGTERFIRRARHNWGRLNPRQLSYLSPEHCTNDRLDARTDVFSLATIFWELLTGRILFQEENEFDRMRAICEEQAPPPTRVNDAIPPLLNSLVLKALAIEPAERFPDAAKMKEVLEGVFSRTRPPASHEEAAQAIGSAASSRLQRWKQLESARRDDDLKGAVEHAAALYGIDSSRAQLPGAQTQKLAEGVEPGESEGASPEEDLSRQEKLEKLRKLKPDRPEEQDIHQEETRRHDQNEHPVARDFEVDDPDEPIDSAVESVSETDWSESSEEPPGEEATQKIGDDKLEPFQDDAGPEESGGVPGGEWSSPDPTAVDESAEERAEQTSARSLLEGDDEPEQEATREVETPDREELESETSLDESSAPVEAAAESDRQDDTAEFDPTADSEPLTDEADDLAEPATDELGDGPSPESITEEVGDFAGPSAGAAADEPGSESITEEVDTGLESGPTADAGGPEGDDQTSDERRSEESIDDVGAELRTMSIDDWLAEEEDQEPFEEPFPLAEVIEDREESDQKRVRQPALEIISIGEDKPLEVSVLRGRQKWSHEGIPVRVESRGKKAVVSLDEPSSGWIVRSDQPGQRQQLPSPPAEVELKPGDVAEISDGEVSYRFRYFHPPKSPDHVRRQNAGRTVGTYAVASALAIAFHAVVAVGLIQLHKSFAVSLSVQKNPPKEVFAKGKMKKFKKKKKKDPPKKKPPPEPPEPADPAEQEAQVPENVQKEIQEKLEEKRDQAEDKTKAEALAAALSGSENKKDSVAESVSNIDAVDSPGDSSSDVEIGGKLEGTEGNEVKMNTGGGGDSKLGDIGSQIGDGTGKLAERENKKEKVRGTVSSVDSNADVAGTLSRGKVTRVVNRHKGRIQGCYEDQLLQNPGIGGKVTFEWTITRSGSVTGARQKTSTLGSSTVSNCILNIIRGMEFPKPKGGSVTVSYPFMFRSAG